MSDLQIALIALGALIIVAVLILNWWQERRFHRQVEKQFTDLRNEALSPESESATIADGHDEDYTIAQPGVDDAQDADNFTINVQVKLDVAGDPAFEELATPVADTKQEPAADLPQVSSASTASAGLPSMLQTKIDTTALLYLASESTMVILQEASLGLFDGLDKPYCIHALDKANFWHALDDANSTSHRAINRVACSLQLADRGGAVSRSTLSRFQLAVTDLALKINADLEWQELDDIQLQATELDAFCIAVDKTVGFHLSHGEQGAFSASQLINLAETQGLVANEAGCLQASHPESGKPSFVLFNAEHALKARDGVSDALIKTVTFQLDIPRVEECSLAFKRMVALAKLMAKDLNANLLDANNKTLSDKQIDQIFQQLQSIQDAMIARGIEPGSEAALRLFS